MTMMMVRYLRMELQKLRFRIFDDLQLEELTRSPRTLVKLGLHLLVHLVRDDRMSSFSPYFILFYFDFIPGKQQA